MRSGLMLMKIRERCSAIQFETNIISDITVSGKKNSGLEVFYIIEKIRRSVAIEFIGH
ncbi:MAG: hypothetical protein IPI04_18605 [Ignavibacteria bacterium]|nr:hypothetical protein [Ignavibacteria bacterium]